MAASREDRNQASDSQGSEASVPGGPAKVVSARKVCAHALAASSLAGRLRGVEGGSQSPPRAPSLEIDSGQPPEGWAKFLA